MTTPSIIKHSALLFTLTIITYGIFFPINTFSSNYPLEIIQPKAGLNTLNRFYKAYPGLEYNVRMAVIGGTYPYTYSLASAPAGMIINSTTGEINWPNPIASGTPYNITARVLDSELSEQTVSWTILVTTTGFRFIDSVNGTLATAGGTGSISNPWKSFIDIYEGNDYASKSRNSYAGEFLYFRNGTYTVGDGYREEDSGINVPFVNNYKPQVWLAYPGENPVINLQPAYIHIYSGGSNLYFDKLEFNVTGNARGKGVQIDSGGSNVTFRKNTFHGITNGYIGGNNALLFIGDAGKGNFWSIQDNIGYDVNLGYWLLGYSANKVLVENNYVYNVEIHSISPKLNTSMWFIRGNRVFGTSNNGILVQYYATSTDIEISHNFVKMTTGKAVRLNSESVTTGGKVYVLRNTLLGGVEAIRTTSTNGPFYFNNNVIINETTYQDKIQRTSIDDASRLIIQNNLTGNSSANIVDSNGNLTTDYSSYLGIYGYQTGLTSTPPLNLIPNPPTGVSIR